MADNLLYGVVKTFQGVLELESVAIDQETEKQIVLKARSRIFSCKKQISKSEYVGKLYRTHFEAITGYILERQSSIERMKDWISGYERDIGQAEALERELRASL